MKKIILIVTGLMLATSASAYVDGAYLGAAMGWDAVYQSGFTDLNDPISNENGIAGRIYAGYKFNEYIALETGFTKFGNVNAYGTNASIAYTANGTVKTYAVDFIAKGMIPLQNSFGLFATLGGAYLNHQAQIISSSIFGTVDDDASQSVIAPTFGLGASYEINPNLVTEISWSRIQGEANHSSSVGNTDFVGLNLSYHFG